MEQQTDLLGTILYVVIFVIFVIVMKLPKKSQKDTDKGE